MQRIFKYDDIQNLVLAYCKELSILIIWIAFPRRHMQYYELIKIVSFLPTLFLL